MSAAVPTLPSPKPYTPRSHPVAILAGPHVPTILTEGLSVQPAPALPRGFQIRCSWCRCSVGTDHEPGSYDCLETGRERTASQSDE